MIDLREKRRRFKRKFPDPSDESAAQPKETILDMSVSKLAKAKTQVHLEHSLRKTVMIVNTIRRLEEELESGCDPMKTTRMCTIERHCVTNGTCSDTRLSDCPMPNSDLVTNNTEVSPLRLSGPLRSQNTTCNTKIETFTNDRYLRSVATSDHCSDETIEHASSDLKKAGRQNRVILNKCLRRPHRDLARRDEDSEINFAEIDIALYDFDAWSETGLHLPFEDNDHVYKTNNGLSGLIRRCSDDLKLTKAAETSFTDDLDQIMQVLVGI